MAAVDCPANRFSGFRVSLLSTAVEGKSNCCKGGDLGPAGFEQALEKPSVSPNCPRRRCNKPNLSMAHGSAISRR